MLGLRVQGQLFLKLCGERTGLATTQALLSFDISEVAGSNLAATLEVSFVRFGGRPLLKGLAGHGLGSPVRQAIGGF